MSNICYWEKLTLSKLVGKENFLKNEKVQGIFGETFILALLSSDFF